MLRRPRGTAAALLVAAMLVATTAPAIGAGDPVTDLTGRVQDTVKGAGDAVAKPLRDAAAPKKPGAAAGADRPAGPSKVRADQPSQPPGEPSDSDESGANEVDDPTPPDHGAADVARVGAGDQEIVRVGGTRSTVEDDDETTSEATLLAIGGTTVIGADADSEGQDNETVFDATPITDPVCEESEEAVCLQIMYADANATEDGTTSHSDSSTGVLSACIGGDNGDSAECESPVNASVAESGSQADRDQRSGRTSASSYSGLADVCLSQSGSELPELPELPLPVPGGDEAACAIGLALVQSGGDADSGGANRSAARGSSVATVTAGGQETTVEDPEAFELPPGCPAGGSLVCGYVNQGETYLNDDFVAGHAQEALKATVLPGILDLSFLFGRSETLVHNDGGEDPGEVAGEEAAAPGGAPGVGRAAPAAAVAGGDGLLPNTGGPWSGLLPLGLIALGAGSLLLADARRRSLAAAPA